MRILLLLWLAVLSLPAFSFEKWECKGAYGTWDKILVTATVSDRRTSGQIYVSGGKHEAIFELQGFKRRWDFGFDSESDSYFYSFQILPDGSARYFNFSLSEDGKAKPSMYFSCREVKMKAVTAKLDHGESSSAGPSK